MEFTPTVFAAKITDGSICAKLSSDKKGTFYQSVIKYEA